MNSAVVLGTCLLAAALTTLIAYGACFAEFSARRQITEARHAAFRIGGAQLAWLIGTGLAAALGFYSDFELAPLRLPLTLLVGWVLLIIFLRSEQYGRIVHFTPFAWPIALQSMRALIEVGLWQLHRDGLLPRHLTFEGYNFDIVVGLTAPLVAIGASQRRLDVRVAIAWNFVGIGFLAAIVFMAITSAPGPQHLPWPGIPNRVLGLFPTVWLPTFFVPVALLGHITSLKQLFAARRALSATRQ